MPIRRFLLVLALAVAACGSPAPSESQALSEPGDLALACWGIDAAECERALVQASGFLPPDHLPIVAASVQAWGCDEEPCAEVGLRRGGFLSIHYANGGGLEAWTVGTAPDGSLVLDDHASGLPDPFVPESGRVALPAVDFSLGHCGLGSPIDVDGSFWDPVGPVDSNAPDAINSSQGTFSLIGPNDAQFRSRTGFVVNLRRHEGAKDFFGCD